MLTPSGMHKAYSQMVTHEILKGVAQQVMRDEVASDDHAAIATQMVAKKEFDFSPHSTLGILVDRLIGLSDMKVAAKGHFAQAFRDAWAQDEYTRTTAHQIVDKLTLRVERDFERLQDTVTQQIDPLVDGVEQALASYRSTPDRTPNTAIVKFDWGVLNDGGVTNDVMVYCNDHAKAFNSTGPEMRKINLKNCQVAFDKAPLLIPTGESTRQIIELWNRNDAVKQRFTSDRLEEIVDGVRLVLPCNNLMAVIANNDTRLLADALTDVSQNYSDLEFLTQALQNVEDSQSKAALSYIEKAQRQINLCLGAAVVYRDSTARNYAILGTEDVDGTEVIITNGDTVEDMDRSDVTPQEIVNVVDLARSQGQFYDRRLGLNYLLSNVSEANIRNMEMAGARESEFKKRDQKFFASAVTKTLRDWGVAHQTNLKTPKAVDVAIGKCLSMPAEISVPITEMVLSTIEVLPQVTALHRYLDFHVRQEIREDKEPVDRQKKVKKGKAKALVELGFDILTPQSTLI